MNAWMYCAVIVLLCSLPLRVDAQSTPSLGYQDSLQQYNDGRRDPAFVRAVARRARQEKDDATAVRVSAAYTSDLQNPYTRENIEFLGEFTRRSADKGFELFYRHGDRVDSIVGVPGYAQSIVDFVITAEEITTRIAPGGRPVTTTPDWKALRSLIAKKYTASRADRLVLNAQLDFYRKRQDWREYARLRDVHIERYPPKAGDGIAGDPWRLNHYAWDAFLHCTDTTVLSRALAWSELSLTFEPEGVQYLDTKANLLYKLGRTAEAIAWQQKAIEQEIAHQQGEARGPLFEEIRATLAKMKRGEPTWPTQ